MDIIYEIRRRHSVQKQTITAIARDMGISRSTVRKYLHTVEEPKYERVQPAFPRLGQFEAQLTKWLEEEAKLPRPRRRFRGQCGGARAAAASLAAEADAVPVSVGVGALIDSVTGRDCRTPRVCHVGAAWLESVINSFSRSPMNGCRESLKPVSRRLSVRVLLNRCCTNTD